MRLIASTTSLYLCLTCLAPLRANAADQFSFEPNLGQTAGDVRYLARSTNGVAFVTDRGVEFRGDGQSIPAFELISADLSTPWIAEQNNGETVSYFVGRDPSKWVENAPHYSRLVRHNVYPGIDFALYGSAGQLEYDFLLAPQADPSRIRLKLTSARGISIDAGGSLIVNTAAGELLHRKPVLFETLPDGSRRSIGGNFKILGIDEVGFAVHDHDPALALSIDPVLRSSTYFGGHGDDQVIGTDGNGALVGNTTSIDVSGAPFARRSGMNVFVKQGQQTTVFGCSGNVTATSAAFNGYSQAQIAVGGYADCSDLPTNLPLPGSPPLQPDYGGGATDGFLILFFSEMDQSGNTTMSYIGGPGDDRVNAVALNTTLVLAGSTSQGGLPRPPNQPVNAKPSGGMDAFVMSGFAIRSIPVILYSTIYLGGSGDDTALGIAFGLAGSCYITGETKSPDFPLLSALNSKRAGDSDAFIARIPGCIGSPIAVTLFGGSNSDRGVAVATLPFGNIVVAGVTSSTDLPLLNPTQKAYGGGASDAFVAQFTPDLSTLVSSTYIGGSEADEATSIVGSFPSTVFVGGWTASENFPTVNALQKKYGGGPDDGFLLHFDDDGSIYESTYFGGSGSDRILSLSGFTPSYTGPSYGPTIWLTGTTTSPDLPLENPEHSSLLGPSDGFLAEIDPGLFAVSAVSSVKDIRTSVPLYVGDPSTANLVPFTITSSDPSKVQVASDTTSPGQKSATLIGSGFAAAEFFYADCLTDSGGANLTISASGFRTRIVHASCFPPAITIVSDATNPGTLKTNIGAFGGIQVSAYLVADPKNPVYIADGVTRPGATPIIAEVTNSNPDIGMLSAELLSFQNSSYQSVTFTPLAVGTTNLAFTAGDIPFLPLNTLTINVGGSYQPPYPFSVPAGFQTTLELGTVSADQTGKILTVTSQDPSRVALSLDSTKRGGKSVSVPWYSLNQSIWVQALASSGDVQLTISVTGEPDIKTTVHLTTPLATLSTPSNVVTQPVVLAPGKIGFFIFYVTVPGGLGNYTLNPGTTPLTVTLQSSHSNVLNIVTGKAQIAPGASSYFSFEVTGAAAGSTVLTVQNSAHIPNSKTSSSLTVNVTVPATKTLFPDVEVGKGLIAQMSLTLPEPASSDELITLAVDDPTLALLSVDNTKAGLPQITTVITPGGGGVQFFVYGLASSGQAKVTATLPGSVLTANVNLDRSGFYWTDETLDSTGGGFIQESLLVGPLDTASSIPVGTQALQPGIAGTIGIASSNSSIASADSITLPLASPSPGAPITIGIQTKPAATGSATLSLHQPSGFSTPSVRQKLVVNVAKSSIAISSGVLGKNTQTPLNIAVEFGTTPTLTITCSDRSKVLLSANPAKLGSSSVAVVAGKTVYAQALAASGSVTIKVSAAGLIGASQVFSLAPTGFGITLDQLNTTQSGGKFFSSLLSKPASVQVGLYQGRQQIYPLTLLPGLGSLSAKITSSNTSVATIAGSPSSFPSGTPTVTPVGAGETVISISQPPGFTSVGNDTVTLDVVAPRLSVNGFIAARDTVSGGSITLPQGLAPMTADLAVTVTSSDPSRILVSSDPAGTPGATATITIKAGSQSAYYFAHVLSDNGKVPIQVTAPGFTASALTAELVPLSFEFSIFQNPPIVTNVQAGPQTIGVKAIPLIATGTNSPYDVALRPGISPISVNVASSNPQVVSVSPSKLVFSSNSSAVVTYTPLKAGTATLKLTAPSAYPIVASLGQVPIVVNAAKIVLPSSLQVGKDLEVPISYVAPSDKSMTVTSSNPSVLLVSPDQSTPGQASIVVESSAYNSNVFAQALAASGNATLTFTMSGFPTATLPVTLTPSGAVFTNAAVEQSLAAGSMAPQYPVSLAPLDPVTLEPTGPGTLRPGASFTVTATSSDPKIVSITTPTVTPGGSLGIQPLAVGTAIVTLAPIGGGSAPASGNLIVVNVYQP